jgi:hypothetical protein
MNVGGERVGAEERRFRDLHVLRPANHLNAVADGEAGAPADDLNAVRQAHTGFERMRSRSLASRSLKGSSNSRTLGSRTTARAKATRCCWPPESWLL